MSVSPMQEWAEGLRYGIDCNGEHELVDGVNALVQTSVDKRWLEKCVDDLLLRPGQSVLQVGFGVGICAAAIQASAPSTHVIIENSIASLEMLRAWAQGLQGVQIVEGSWVKTLPRLGTFDRIFFDGCNDVELTRKELELCPDSRMRSVGNAMVELGASPANILQAIARAWHCKDANSRTASTQGTELMSWSDTVYYAVDKDGCEMQMDGDGTQITMEWEKQLKEKCVDQLNIDNKSDVLEVGFGCGYSAERIQLADPRSHTIVECAEAALQRLRKWAADKPTVRVVDGSWQTRLPELASFDCVFFDDGGLHGLTDVEMRRCPDPFYQETYSRALQHGASAWEAAVNVVLKFHGRHGCRITGGSPMHPLTAGVPEVCGLQSEFQLVSVMPPSHCDYYCNQYAVVPVCRCQDKSKDQSKAEGSTSAGSGPRSDDEATSSQETRSRAASSRDRSRSPMRMETPANHANS